MTITLDYYSISLLIGGFSALLSGFTVLASNRGGLINQAWFALTVSTAVWSFGYFVMIVTTSDEIASMANYILHVAATSIPLFYFLFILRITNTYKKHKDLLLFFSIMAGFFLVINHTDLFIASVTPKGIFNFAPNAGPLYILFAVYFFSQVILSLLIVSRNLLASPRPLERQRLKYIIYLTLSAVIGGGGVFLYTFNILVPPYPLILFALYPVISGYAIMRYQLFDVKVFTAQFLTFGLWIFILIRTLLSQSLREQIINGSLLIITIALGIFLIRSVAQEVRASEQLQRLAEDLRDANAKLHKINMLKSEFVSVATHQLRSPLTAIKGYTSMILEGTYGNVPDEMREPLERVSRSTASLTQVVQDFLDVSRIEQGRMKYDMAAFSFKDLLSEVVAEQEPNIDKSGLEFSVDIQDENDPDAYVVRGDRVKLKQVIGNLVDNAIKYTKEGFVRVKLKHGSNVRLEVEDSGMGIDKKTLGTLFSKFNRADNADEVNVSGTGLGLYIAREIMGTHNGKVWAESEGTGKGSTFVVEVPTTERG